MFILYGLPKNLLSYWVGKLMHFQFPSFIAQFLIRHFIKLYEINESEAELPIEHYKSIGDFFIRKLKAGSRPLSPENFVHPADSKMTARGLVLAGQILQAKGRNYSLVEFLRESDDSRWLNGYYITYYLCPTDYHRVHSPVEGRIKEIRYVPGELWPVNDWSISNIDKLFIKNERVIIEIETTLGPIAVVLVGATNVGSIRLSFEPSLKTNHAHKRKENKLTYVEPIPIAKGAELGMFCMGSTVIVVAHSQWKILDSVTKSAVPQKVNMGQF